VPCRSVARRPTAKAVAGLLLAAAGAGCALVGGAVAGAAPRHPAPPRRAAARRPPPPPPLAPTAAWRRIVWGMGDQNYELFSDRRWRQMPMRHVRYFVPWDLRREPRYLRAADRWLRTARRAHAIPLIAFTQSDRRGHSRDLPTRAQYRHNVGWIVHRYSWVREWTPWNEANLLDQPTLRSPGRTAEFWKYLRHRCPTCTVTSPSLVGYSHSPTRWLHRFLRAAKGLNGPWALHLYNDVNEFHPYALSRFVRLLRGPLWVTEANGWLRFFPRLKLNYRRQERAVRYLFTLAAQAYPRVQRWYLYQWFGSPGHLRWDSGLVDRHARARPAMRVVQRRVLPRGVAGIR